MLEVVVVVEKIVASRLLWVDHCATQCVGLKVLCQVIKLTLVMIMSCQLLSRYLEIYQMPIKMQDSCYQLNNFEQIKLKFIFCQLAIG